MFENRKVRKLSKISGLGQYPNRSTSIAWTQDTWNPWCGCSRVSGGCANCYAERMARRLALMGRDAYDGLVSGNGHWTGLINRNSETQFQFPYSLKSGLVFVCSMSDFWHSNVPLEWRAEALRIIVANPQLTFQIPTKRPENIMPMLLEAGYEEAPSNVWLGASVEDHRVADRIDPLRSVPAAVRFLSVEPLTAPLGKVDLNGIDWVIVGGESGHGARPIQADWVREVRDQCLEAGSKFFFKQWGKPIFNPLAADFQTLKEPGETLADFIGRVDSDEKGGHLLDGVRWRQYPA